MGALELRKLAILLIQPCSGFIQLLVDKRLRLVRLIVDVASILFHEHRCDFRANLLRQLRIAEAHTHGEARQICILYSGHRFEGRDCDRRAKAVNQVFHVDFGAIMRIQMKLFDNRFQARAA